jgi:hypothetical protein
MRMQLHDNGPISPSTAYDGCQSPFICMEWVWEAFHVGLEPQSMHNGYTWYQAVTQDFSWFPKS